MIRSRLLKDVVPWVTMPRARALASLSKSTTHKKHQLMAKLQLCHQHQVSNCGNVSLRSFAASAAPPSSYNPDYPPILFDLVLRADWKSALKRVSSHPIEARYRHPRGYTLLHCAVEYQAPVELIDKMAKAHPEALKMKDYQGRSIVDVAIDDETKAYLETLSQSDLQQSQQHDVEECKSGGIGPNFSLSQVEAISKQLLEIENSCRKLRIQLDALTDKVKGK